jgi:hypothetical protein
MITKYTTGCIQQIFDNNGNLISQEFIVDNLSEYEDENGDPIDEDHPGNDFYAPYDMKNG